VILHELFPVSKILMEGVEVRIFPGIKLLERVAGIPVERR
jgi:hypothetical protein